MITATINLHRSVLKNTLSLYNLEEDVIIYRECSIDILTNGKYKIYGLEHDTIESACKAVDRRFASFEAQMEMQSA